MKSRSNAQLMRQHWDERAREDAFRYIVSGREDWASEDFFASGEEDFDRFVAPVLQRLGLDPEGKLALDLGCGAGRLTRALARRFGRVIGVDVSSEMLRQARALNAGIHNLEWLLSDGRDLPVADARADFVLSYLVIQHIPSREGALALIRDMLRVLSPGGVFLFQWNSAFEPTMSLRGRAFWSVVDRLRNRSGERMERAAKWLACRAGMDPLMSGSTWRGAALRPNAVLETLWAGDASVVGVTGWGTPHAWCYGFRFRGLPRAEVDTEWLQ